MEKIISRLTHEFDACHKRDIKGRSNWTVGFKQCLWKVGKELGYKVYACSLDIPADEGGAEWLFDVCWTEDTGRGRWKGLKLICESEWNTGKEDILDDFQKLAVAKAEYKIMLVQFNHVNEFEQIKKWCEESVDESLYNDGSKYFLVGSGNSEENIRFERLWDSN